MKDYHINIFYSEDDKGYIADIPDLKTCSAFGETHKKALKEVLIAKKLWIKVAKDTKMDIPKANYKPLIYQY